MYDLATEHPETVETEMTFMDLAKENGWIQEDQTGTHEKPSDAKKRTRKKDLIESKAKSENKTVCISIPKQNLEVLKAYSYMTRVSVTKIINDLISNAIPKLTKEIEGKLIYKK